MEKQRRSKEEKIKLGRRIAELKEQGVKEDDICVKLGVPPGSIWKIKKVYQDSLSAQPEPLPDDFLKTMEEGFNGPEKKEHEEKNNDQERVKLLFFPYEKKTPFDCFTIEFNIPAGLEGEERDVVIATAIKDRIDFMEIGGDEN